MSSLVIATQPQPLDQETLKTFLELGMILRYNPCFSELFQEFKNLKHPSDIIDFISESVISIKKNIRELFASIGIHILDEQLESLPEMYYSFKYWINIFTKYVNDNKKKDSYEEKHRYQFIPLVDLIHFLKSFYSTATFQVFVRMLDGSIITPEISCRTTILEIKQMILEKDKSLTKIPVDDLRLMFAGQQLDDIELAGMYNITREANLILLLRMRGGMHHESSTGKLTDEYEKIKEHMSPELREILEEYL